MREKEEHSQIFKYTKEDLNISLDCNQNQNAEQEEIYFSQCNQYQSKEKKLNGTQSGLQTQQDDETKKNT
jgi:hypothetical protein